MKARTETTSYGSPARRRGVAPGRHLPLRDVGDHAFTGLAVSTQRGVGPPGVYLSVEVAPERGRRTLTTVSTIFLLAA